jgi:UDP-N-acetylmuramyl pentapeptide phosphotransferase/UDP-N-acetylglucosamine-1-phosphate transferase
MPCHRRIARSSHKTPTPQGGGIAVIAATIGVAALAAISLGVAVSPLVLFAAALIALVGAIDDIRPLGVLPRLLFQALAVGLVIVSLPADLAVAPFLPWGVERALLLLAGLWFVNLTNFMDGIDWITVAEVVPVTAGLVALSLLGAIPTFAAILALALLGATLGFAPFNKPVARLFLGDVGSLPIGLMLGYLLVLAAGQGHVAAAILLPLYYLADATITLLRRLARGETIWHAHRTHFYQRATDAGFSVPQIVGRIFTVNLGLAILAFLSVWQSGLAAQIATLMLGAALVAFLLIRFERGR